MREELDKRIAEAKDEATEKKALLRSYFRKRTRRVPYAEVDFADSDSNTAVFGSYNASNVLGGTTGESMRPPEEWVFPFDPDDGITHTGYAELRLRTEGGNRIDLPANKTDFPEPEGAETKLGDRVVVGNNLPQTWWDGNKFVTQEQAGQEIQGKVWDDGGTRKRFPQISQLDDLGATGRDQFWEESAAVYPADALDVVGGLRIVTGAGIYLPNDYVSNTNFTDTHKTVWPDNMAMGVTTKAQGLPQDQTPYLQMRATAVYHFQANSYDPNTPSSNPQTPIACVSSYYDPTNATTAQNAPTYESRAIPWNTATGGLSNNGIVYAAPTRGKSSYNNVLDYLASLKYPNGRLVHKQLKKALDKGSGNLTLAEKSALDSAICGLQIRDGSLRVQTTPVIPHGAIRETSFLDARQVKAIDRLGTSSETTYNLDVELRQPLEIRSTVIDLTELKNKSIGTTTHATTEFLLPNSGIIYATRDDALPDLSDDDDPNDNDDKIATSATDFKLDPTRRPNGIMLVNGEELNRTNDNRNQPEEKGLILVSDLPVYIKGDFNKHEHEEFDSKLTSNWSNFYDREKDDLNTNFACRKNQFTGCVDGEKWRPATVLADAITVLSGGFQEGFRNEGDYGLRDNWGYAPIGYDVDGDGTIENTTVTLNEELLKLDLNGDGDTEDSSITRLSEVILGVDIDGDGNKNSTSVIIRENNIPNVVARRLNGFWDNNFVTNFPWQDNVGAGGSAGFGFPATTDTTPQLIRSSYFNNFVTPIQRRAPFAEYVMEICRKPTVSACKPEDWSVGYATGGVVDWNYKAVNSEDLTESPPIERIETSFTVDRLGAGTTARPALNEADRGFPRRVAFLRDAAGNLILDDNDTGASEKVPIVLGISGTDNPTNLTQDNAGQVTYYRMHSRNTGELQVGIPDKLRKMNDSNRPRLHPRALWFKTRNYTSSTASAPNYGYKYPLWIDNLDSLTNSSSNQPLLVPVLQIHYPFEETDDSINSNFTSRNDDDIQGRDNNWVQNATNPSGGNETQTNLVIAQGDTPARPTESNGGLENFVRYLEKWTGQTHKASGSFIQYKRSSYATAPWYPIIAPYNNKSRGFSTNGTILGYPQFYRTTVNKHGNETFGRTPFYVQPANRAWGFDVALLTQIPDLFSQRFTAPPSGEPNEFYREVSRDDSWVSTLLCAAESEAKPAEYGTAPSTKYGADKEYAIPQNQRPDPCK